MVMERFRLDGRRALVIGVGPGIGSAVAMGLAEAGAAVVACSRTSLRVDGLVDAIRTAGGQASGVAGDVTDAAFRAELLAFAGAVDILFYAAYTLDAGHGSTFDYASPLETSDADWEACFRGNLLAPFAMARAVIPGMMERRRGSVIHCTAAAAFSPILPAIAYGSTKAGLATMTRYLAKASGPHVRVNAIAPSNVAVPGRPEALAQAATSFPLGRIGAPDEVAATAVYLASDAAGFVTGEVIHVDGGRVPTA